MEIKSCDGRAYCLLLFAALIFSQVQISITEVCSRVPDSFCKFTCSDTEIELKVNTKTVCKPAESTHTYSYKPCGEGLSCDTKDNKTCAICQDDQYSVGYLDENVLFHDYTPSNKSFVISYRGSEDATESGCGPTNPYRRSTVLVECKEIGAPSLECVEEDKPKCTYAFKLTAACSISTPSPSKHSGLSIGSIIIIVFVVVFILYIVIGFLIQRFVRGAQGIDQIPNREFWVEIPILTKEGCCFVIGCCRQRATSYYEKI